MTLTEEALLLRDRIYETAPEAVKSVIGDKSLVALYCAKDYFEAEKDMTCASVAESHENSILYFYNLRSSQSAWEAAWAVTLFKMNKSIDCIARMLEMEFEEAQQILDKHFPLCGWDVKLSNLNDAALGKTHDYNVSAKMRELNWRPIPLTQDVLSPKEAAYQLFLGHGVGDIAAQYGLSIMDVMAALKKYDVDGFSKEEVIAVQDYIRGKTPEFIAEKLAASAASVKGTLRTYGYAVGSDSSGIEYINMLIDDRHPALYNGSIQLAYHQEELPSTAYVTLPPIVETADKVVLSKHQGDLLLTLTGMIGCTLDEFKVLVKEAGNARSLYGEYVPVVRRA